MIASVLVLAAALPACGDNGANDPGSEGGGAAGRVLGGEVSDAMVPLDTVRSTSPAAPRATTTGAGTARSVAERGEDLPQAEGTEPPESNPASPNADDTPSPPEE